jgi:16S rRNA processing protein RimM
VGKVIRPHGRGGLLRIQSYTESERSFLDAGMVFLKPGAGEIEEHAVISAKPHKNVLLVALKGVNGRDEAEQYIGAEVFLEKKALHREEDEYFLYELQGLRVYLDTGEYVGRIAHVISAKGHDTYVIKGPENEILVPAVTEVVKEIDIERGLMTISPVEGLLDLNEV